MILKGVDLIFPLRDEICRQEFQYAKKTVKKPVIPVVVGSSFDWMMTVVGLLIAGEIYIHFSNKDVQEIKMTELLKAIKKSVPQVRVPGSLGSTQGGFDKITYLEIACEQFLMHCSVSKGGLLRRRSFRSSRNFVPQDCVASPKTICLGG